MNALRILLETIVDVLPIVAVIFGFQYAVLRQPLRQPIRVLTGFVMVLLGLALFLLGLEQALFPLGAMMAEQLASPDFLPPLAEGALRHWSDYYWIYLFAFSIGAATTIAEPALIAVSLKASEVSGGTIDPLWLRVAVALGMAIGITLGVWRIVMGLPLIWFVLAAYLLVIVQTLRAPRSIIALAYDSGGVTTSTITVPVITALGLGLAGSLGGRDALLDGFGMIALACLFPIVTVMGYAQLAEWQTTRRKRRTPGESNDALQNDHRAGR